MFSLLSGDMLADGSDYHVTVHEGGRPKVMRGRDGRRTLWAWTDAGKQIGWVGRWVEGVTHVGLGLLHAPPPPPNAPLFGDSRRVRLLPSTLSQGSMLSKTEDTQEQWTIFGRSQETSAALRYLERPDHFSHKLDQRGGAGAPKETSKSLSDIEIVGQIGGGGGKYPHFPLPPSPSIRCRGLVPTPTPHKLCVFCSNSSPNLSLPSNLVRKIF